MNSQVCTRCIWFIFKIHELLFLFLGNLLSCVHHTIHSEGISCVGGLKKSRLLQSPCKFYTFVTLMSVSACHLFIKELVAGF